MLPELGYIFIAPDILIDSKAFRTLHNTMAKNAVREVLEWHWREMLPKHFRPEGHNRYQYKQRGWSYQRQKRAKYHSISDLVKTGKTKRMMLASKPHISVGGRAIKGGMLNGKYKLKFPFPIGDPGPKIKVKPRDMVKEVSAWAPEEILTAARKLKHSYTRQLVKELRTRPKWRKQIAAAKRGN